jgi:hypothetical protein
VSAAGLPDGYSTIQAERLLRHLVALPAPLLLDAGHFKNNYQEQDQRKCQATGDPQGRSELPFPTHTHPQQGENPKAQSDSQEPSEGHPVAIILRRRGKKTTATN